MAKASNIEGGAKEYAKSHHTYTALAGEHCSSNLQFVCGSQSEESKGRTELKS